MTIAEFLSHLNSLDVKLWAESDQLRCNAPKGVLTPALQKELENRKEEILLLLKSVDRNGGSARSPIVPLPREGTLPLSFAQERLWFLYHLFPESPAYNIPILLRLAGPMDRSALRKSLQALVERHESLRTCFPTIDDQPVQVIRDNCPLPLVEHNLRDLPEAERETAADQLTEEEILRPFDLTTGPVFRASLLRMAAQEHILLVTLHHIVTDGWSRGIIHRDLAAFYNAAVLHQPPALPPLTIQYADYAQWQRQWLSGEVLEGQLRYWRTQLADLAPLELPTDRPRPSVQTHSGAGYRFQVSTALTQGLRILSRQAEVTVATTLLAAFQVLLGRYSGQTDIAVGSPIANRTRSELEHLVGFFVNTLVMRTDLSGDPTFRAVLARVHDVALGAYDHQDLPFEQLVAELQPERDFSRNPLFQVIFAFQNVPREGAAFQGLTLHSMRKEITTTRMDLECFVAEGNEELQVTVVFNTDLFDGDTIKRFGTHFHTVLTEVVRDPAQRLSQLSLLDEAERQQLLVEWNTTKRDYPKASCIHQLFEAQAEQTPDAVAVIFEEQELTYAELNARANQLAQYLRQQYSVGAEVRVGLCLERSLEMVVGLLGILKAGGAYVPLDPTHPPARLAYVLEDAQIQVLLTQERLLEILPQTKARVVCVDTDPACLPSGKATTPDSQATAGNVAYLIYTSGSTGQPKGVAIEHRSAVALLHWAKEVFGADELRGVLASTSICFDLSVFELFVPLSWGGTVILAQNVLALPGLPKAEEVTLINTVPSALAALLRGTTLPASVRTVNLAGEPLRPQLVRQIQKAGTVEKVYDLYGPSEDTTYSTRALREGEGPETIGRPIANTQVYLLDRYLEPVPIGVSGEVYLGGAGLARGYYNRSALTAERFIPHPFAHKPGARLYKTGDVARHLADGTIQYLGRVDHQIKLRGYRIELGEIEAVLTQHPGVQESVVVEREDAPGEKRLVGYVVPAEESVSPSDLRQFLKETLPEYMVPAIFVMLDALPLTPNGKVDRKALPVPEGVRPELDAAYQAPHPGVEETLAQLWKQVLRIDQVGRQDNFFELGGDSILSIQIVAKGNQAGLRVTPRLLFQYQTIAELAAVVGALEPVTAEQGVVTGPLPLTPIQQWFFAQQIEAPHHWNMAWVLEAKEPLDPQKMEQVVAALVGHHDALRLRFIPHGPGWQQELGAPSEPVPFTAMDLSHVAAPEAEAAYTQEANRLHTTLHLTEGPLIRVALFHFGQHQADRVLLVIHHLAVDGISWRILLDDLQTAYAQLCERKSIQLPPKTASFKQWAEDLVAYAQSDVLEQEVSYWQTVATTPCPPLPRDVADGINTVASTQTVSVVLGREDTQALLQDIPEVYHTQINDVLLTALVDVLAHWSQQETVCLDLEGHGREDLVEDIDLSRTVGWFTSIFPVVLKKGHPAHPGELLKSVKEQLRQIPHRGMGYGLLRYVREDGKIRAHLGERPDSEVSFNYLGQFAQVIQPEGQWRWSGASVGAARAPRGKQPHLVSINARIMDSVLQVKWSYSDAVHRRETIETLAKNYLAALRAIIRHCQLPEAGGYTPSDFPLAKISQQELDRVLTHVRSERSKPKLADLYPLTPLQQGLWFHALADPESGVYFQQSVVRLEGILDRDVLRRAWEEVVARHAILRTGLIWDGLDHPLQFVQATVTLPWAEHDWRGGPAHEHPARLTNFLDADRGRGFDLTHAPLMRLTLLQVAETAAILVWSFHHLILDRWSVDVVQQEVWSAYQALVQGRSLQFKALRPYRDYLGWLQEQDLHQAEHYWRQRLRGFTTPTVLGVDQAPTRVEHQAGGYDSVVVTLSETATTALSRWARHQQLTVNTVVQGAWAVLLSRYSGSADVVFGATVSGRTAGLPGIESMVGLFINTLPMRVHVSPSHAVVEWLRQLQAQQVTLREYEYTPLFEIPKWSEVPPGASLFQTLVVFENTPQESGMNSMAQAAGLNLQRVAGRGGGSTTYSLTVVVVPGRTLRLRFTYDTEHYTGEAITRLVDHFQQVLAGIVGGTEQQLLGALPLLTEAERHQLLVEWNDTATPYPREATLAERFEAQVAATPDAMALVFEEDTLSYAELNTRANQLAQYLRQQYGVGPEVRVGLCVDRSLDMVVGLLGILKAGGAYVPLDPSAPPGRLAFMVKDADLRVILTQEKFQEHLSQFEAPHIRLDADWPVIGQEEESTPVSEARADSLAYVIYTSGSTGRPKGVEVEHRQILNYVDGILERLKLPAGSSFATVSPLTADLGNTMLYPALATGGTLHIISEDRATDPEALGAYFRHHQPDCLKIVPSHLATLLMGMAPAEVLPQKRLVVGGEACPWHLVKKVQALKPACRVINHYGPTETTVGVTTHQVEATKRTSSHSLGVPIGRPLANSQLYLLDEHKKPVPLGVPGEIYIGGRGLARGYTDAPELTADKFLPHPYSKQPGARLYKTGDRARFQPDGTIEFLGRIDHQVKLRGFRIELGEIESVLATHLQVPVVLGLYGDETGGTQRLVAYIGGEGRALPSVEEIKVFLKTTLPDYMIPANLVVLESLPVLPNGKVDRHALPDPEGVTDWETEFVAPRNLTEEIIASIWADVLQRERVSLHDNFFDLGGHSLLATQVVLRMRDAFGVNMKLGYFFETPTIAGMAESIETLKWKTKAPLRVGETNSPDRKRGRL